MLVKASIAATAALVVAVSLSRVDYREQYNEMYPVDGLKRDTLGLCGEARASFIRALRSDRIACYDSMPDAIDLAIGWVRTADRLAAMKPASAIELAERLLAEAEIRGGMLGPPQFTGYVAAPPAVRPCVATALARVAAGPDSPLMESDARLARRIARDGDAALAALGIAPRVGAPDAQREPALPILPLGGGAAIEPQPAAGAGLPLAGCGTRA